MAAPVVTKMSVNLHIATEENRWLILHALGRFSEPVSIARLAKKLKMSPQHILFHLRKLMAADLVQMKLVEPERGGLKIKLFSLVPQDLVVRIDENGARVKANA